MTFLELFKLTCSSLSINYNIFTNESKLMILNTSIDNFYNILFEKGCYEFLTEKLNYIIDINVDYNIELKSRLISVRNIYSLYGSEKSSISLYDYYNRSDYYILNGDNITIKSSYSNICIECIFKYDFSNYNEELIFPLSKDINLFTMNLKVTILQFMNDFKLVDIVKLEIEKYLIGAYQRYKSYNIGANTNIQL